MPQARADDFLCMQTPYGGRAAPRSTSVVVDYNTCKSVGYSQRAGSENELRRLLGVDERVDRGFKEALAQPLPWPRAGDPLRGHGVTRAGDHEQAATRGQRPLETRVVDRQGARERDHVVAAVG